MLYPIPEPHTLWSYEILISQQALPLSPSVTKINPNGVAALAIDVDYLVQFVSSLGDMALLQQLDELQQTVS